MSVFWRVSAVFVFLCLPVSVLKVFPTKASSPPSGVLLSNGLGSVGFGVFNDRFSLGLTVEFRVESFRGCAHRGLRGCLGAASAAARGGGRNPEVADYGSGMFRVLVLQGFGVLGF